MESWRGRGRRVGSEALGWLAAAWKTGSGPRGLTTDGSAGLSPGHNETNGATSRGTAAPGNGPAAAGGGAVLDEFPEQRQAGRPEQARVSVPDRREDRSEQNRVPGWLQTAAG